MAALKHTPEKIQAAYIENGGNVSATARQVGCDRGTVKKYCGARPIAGGRVHMENSERRALPTKGLKTYLITSAQNNTHLFERGWDNLMALAAHTKAEVLVGSYSYDVASYGKLAVKRGTVRKHSDLWFDERVLPMLEASDRNIELAPGLVWCGRSNTLPTASRPLQGFESYTGRASGIFPHAKVAMDSIASGKEEATKFNYTTGTVTQLNYIQKTAGIRAEHHHAYAALIVEVTPSGSWYVRQVHLSRDGTLHDLDRKVENGKVTTGNPVEAITWGDIHECELDPVVRQLAWGKGGMLDTLHPRFQFMHDLVDFRARNHHERFNPHRRFELHVKGQESVEAELRDCSKFLHEAGREWCKTLVVDSNHDNALTRWLKETDWRDDMVNAEFYLRAQAEVLKNIRLGNDEFHLIEHVLRELGCPRGVQFLREDESFILCRDARGGIECGMHGHLGLDGAKPSARSFTKMGRKANTAHTHKAGIVDGVYTAGHSSNGRQRYRRGPSSWSWSEIVTYPNGKRAIVTMWDNAWRG
jgi:hypothetical protein